MNAFLVVLKAVPFTSEPNIFFTLRDADVVYVTKIKAFEIYIEIYETLSGENMRYENSKQNKQTSSSFSSFQQLIQK